MSSSDQIFDSKAISSIRFVALCMIVACHIFQGEDMALAWWFNVGVQIYLFISGFLYGTKKITDANAWIKKRLVRILVPYYLLLAVVIAFYLIFARDLLKMNSVLSNISLLQGFTNVFIPGIEHLWFISYIILCYLITPVLQEADISNTKNSTGRYLAELMLLLLGLQILKYLNVINLIIPDIGAYIIGYYFSRRHFYYNKYEGLAKSVSTGRSVTAVFTLCILTTILTIYLQYFCKGGPLSLLLSIKWEISAWNHTILGMSLFLALYLLFDRLYRLKSHRILRCIINWSDVYSYTVYLTHQIFILGKYSMLNITGSKAANITLIIICSVISGMLLEKVNCRTAKKFSPQKFADDQRIIAV